MYCIRVPKLLEFLSNFEKLNNHERVTWLFHLFSSTNYLKTKKKVIAYSKVFLFLEAVWFS